MKGRKSKNRRRGATMAEVIVATAVALLIMAMFTQVVTVCLRTIPRAEALRESVENAVGAYYLGESAASPAGGALTASGSRGSFTLDTGLYANTDDAGTVLYTFEKAS